MMRIYSGRTAAGLLALLLGVCSARVLPARAQAPARDKEASARLGRQTPEQTFAAAQQALKKNDWKGYFDLCDEDTVTAYAGQLVAWYAMKFLASEEALKSQPVEEKLDFARMEAVLKKHHLTDDDCRSFLENQPKFPELDFASPWFQRIKNKRSFDAEMIAAMKSQGDYWTEAGKQFDGARLENVKTSGDRTRADVHFSDGHKERIEFHQVQGAWLVQFPVQESLDYGSSAESRK
jgi:hypothetical protein